MGCFPSSFRGDTVYVRIAKIFGIDINVHVSWLFVFALVVWSLSNDLGPFHHLNLSPSQRVILGTLGALFLFASILIHELAHSLVGRANGIPVSGITLFIFGGVSRFEGEATSAPAAAWISFVGPLASFVLAALFYGLSLLSARSGPLSTVFGYLAGANAVLGIFNLLPAYPLDGGRVLHALLWRATGDRARATQMSVRIGSVFAWLFIAFGIYSTFASGFGSGLWITFIGWFLLQAGNAEGAQVRLVSVARGHAVRELATAPTVTVAADATARQALDAMIAAGAVAAPVMVGGRVIGLVTLDNFRTSVASEMETTFVTAVMDRFDDLPVIAASAEATDALQRLNKAKHGQLVVVDDGGSFVGIVTREAVLKWFHATQTTSGNHG
jgi:Zn-dependent protease/CBS domain-containing protein